MRLVIPVFIFMLAQISFAQNLFDLAIRQIEPSKKSTYYSDGVLHLMKGVSSGKLVDIRHSYSPKRGYERVVFDFTSNSIPKTYAYISNENKKIYLDFFESSFSPSIPDLKNVHNIKGIDFFSIDENNFSVEVNFKSPAGFEIFYLSNPGRLVIDIKK